ncbi:MAG: SOS response-associated peptidase [Candidatus Cloacimonetes bacterium]|nr:SOS response-associated peptidase [Candidatus Cloacimonadota bacterium]
MCGRFAIHTSVTEIKKYADALSKIDKIEENYNVTPGSKIPVIIKQGEANIIDGFQWGLIPFWAKDAKIVYKLINARAESISEKPSFRNAFQRRRCLIPANGFYEWKKPERIPFYIYLNDRELFTFAGIWEKWLSPEGKEIKTCSIITTDPNHLLKTIHNRMPVILNKEDEQKWIDHTNDKASLSSLLQPYPAEKMKAHIVSKAVNSPENNYPELTGAA